VGLLAWALTAAAAAQGACPPAAEAGELLTAGAVQAAWRSEPAVRTVGQPFLMWVTLCPAEARLLRVDATMPEHRHGMNYRPTVHPVGEGRWRVEGLLWHMAGRWELRLDVQQGGDTPVSLRQSVLLR
jgi:hypothetical protein